MSYYLVKSNADVSTMTAIEQKNLSLQETLNSLLAQQIVVVSGFGTDGEDAFVKLGDSNYTQITFTDPSLDTTYWRPYPISLNSFSINTCYNYDENTYKYGVYLRNGAVVKYMNNNVVTAGIINGTYLSTDKNLYYTITGDENVYQLQQSVVPSGIANADPTIPVLDPTIDYHQVAVSDYSDTVYVLV